MIINIVFGVIGIAIGVGIMWSLNEPEECVKPDTIKDIKKKVKK